MRTKLIGLFLGGGLIAASLTSALACNYNTTTADNASPSQVAQTDETQAPTPAPAPDKN